MESRNYRTVRVALGLFLILEIFMLTPYFWIRLSWCEQSPWIPSWKEVTYQGSKPLTKLLVRVSIDHAFGKCPYPLKEAASGFLSCPLDCKHCLLISAETVTMSLFFPQEKYEHFVWFEPGDLDTIQRVRWKKSGNRWLKLYRWTEEGVERLVVRPRSEGQEDLLPSRWSRRYKSFYSYPNSFISLDYKGISEPLALFYLVSRLGAKQSKERVRLYVFGKKTLHQVGIRFKKTVHERINYEQAGQQYIKRVKDRRKELFVYTLSSSCVCPKGKKKEPFSLLGLQKNIEFHVDPTTGLILKIKGDNQLLGHIELDLKKALERN